MTNQQVAAKTQEPSLGEWWRYPDRPEDDEGSSHATRYPDTTMGQNVGQII
ncbi:MAG: hypothetical protein KTV45_15925 [Acidimicrobiia bacterium]|nr:hypothetical protein [Acidimicrobiia bacterium]